MLKFDGVKKSILKHFRTFFAIFDGFWMDFLAMPGGKGGADTWLYQMI